MWEMGRAGRRVSCWVVAMVRGGRRFGVGMFVEELCVRLSESTVRAIWAEKGIMRWGGGSVILAGCGMFLVALCEIVFSMVGRPYGEVRYIVTVEFPLSRASQLR